MGDTDKTLILIIGLLAPLVVLGGIAFVLIIAYVKRVSRLTTEAASQPKLTNCPSCGHKLVEIRHFCAECGSPLRQASASTSGDEPELPRDAAG